MENMKRLLTLEDLIEFYSTKKRSMKFDVAESGEEPIVVQVIGNMTFKKEEKDFAEGLTHTRLQACHTNKNLNKSGISYDNMKDKFLPTFKNRPILGYIHYVDGKPQFYDHRMHIEENEDGESELIYDEIAVGIIPETNNAEFIYDEEEKHYNVFVDGYIFNEYTKAAEILEREQECSVSVEISISKMAYNSKEKFLDIQDGYISGVTILGVDEEGNKVMPGMVNSNIKLKDFSKSNNSMFSSITEEEQEQLIEMREKIDTLLSRFNINENSRKEAMENGMEDEIKVNEEVTETEEVEVTETESTEEVTETETTTENESEETVEVDTPEVNENEEVTETESETENKEETAVEETETVETETEEVTETESEETIDATELENKTYSKTFELSHDDVRYALYNLLAPFEEANNDWYWIVSVYDSYFVYEGCMGNYYGQKYTKDGDTVAFDGERYELFAEFVTETEKTQLEEMRANYSSIQSKLASYEKAEMDEKKEAIFNDEAYAEFVETDSFKSIKENMDTYSLDELHTACELAFAKEIKLKGSFSSKAKEEKESMPKKNVFAFAGREKSDFLDNLLKK